MVTIETPRIVGGDLSLTGTAVAADDFTRLISTPAAKIDGPARLVKVRDAVMAIVRFPRLADVVVLEGYSFGQQQGSSQMHSTGELGGVIRVALFEAGVPYVEVPPGTLKVFATGNGQAKKPEMVACARELFDYPHFGDDEADAWLLRCLGMWAYGLRYNPPTKHRRGKVLELKWPALALEARAHLNGSQVKEPSC